MQDKWWWTRRLGVIRPWSSAGVFESPMNQKVLGIVPDRSGHRRQCGKFSSIQMYTLFIDHVVVWVWGPEKVLKFYLPRCRVKGFISCHQHVTAFSFERFFFSRWKDSSFPALGWGILFSKQRCAKLWHPSHCSLSALSCGLRFSRAGILIFPA